MLVSLQYSWKGFQGGAYSKPALAFSGLSVLSLHSYLLYWSCFPSCMDVKAKKMRLAVIRCGVKREGRCRWGKRQAILHWKGLRKWNPFSVADNSLHAEQTAQPCRGSKQLLQLQWPFTGEDWHWDFSAAVLSAFASAAWRAGEKYSYKCYCTCLLQAHYHPPNKSMTRRTSCWRL